VSDVWRQRCRERTRKQMSSCNVLSLLTGTLTLIQRKKYRLLYYIEYFVFIVHGNSYGIARSCLLVSWWLQVPMCHIGRVGMLCL
jgi:hypothetical protein